MTPGEENGTSTGNAGNGGSALSGAVGVSTPPASGNSGGVGNNSSNTPGTQTTGGGTTAIGSGGTTEQKSWRDTLPDDLKSDPTLNKYSDLPNFAKAHIELQKKIGQKGIIKPGPNDSPEAWKAFREALGVPAADKYELGKFEGIQFPSDSLDWAKKAGAEVGVLPEDMTKIMQSYAKFEVERDAAVAKEIDEIAKEQMDGLKKEWGEAYPTNLQKGLFAFKQVAELAGVDQKTAMEWLDSGVGNDVVFIKLMGAASKLFGEDKLKEGGIGDGRLSSQELDTQIATVQSQLFTIKNTDGRYKGLKDQYESLWKQKTGGK